MKISPKEVPNCPTLEQVRGSVSATRFRRGEVPDEADGACLAWSRRWLLSSSFVAAASLSGGLGATLAVPAAARAQNDITPDQALKQLIDGNRRFVEQPMTAFDDDLKLLKEKTASGQAPFAALLSCADSRVPVELIFDQTIGKLFVTRVAGNIATAEMVASLEYGAAVLGTKAIMVLGHSNCGAVKATIDGKPVPGQISTLYRSIRPAVDQAGPNLEAVIKANAKIQAGLLRNSSPVLGELIGKGQLKIIAAYYELATGTVTTIE
jgi:carbonic anhydrase